MISHIFYFLKGTVLKLSILSNRKLHVKEILKLFFYFILELNACLFILFNIFKTLQVIIFFKQIPVVYTIQIPGYITQSYFNSLYSRVDCREQIYS